MAILQSHEYSGPPCLQLLAEKGAAFAAPFYGENRHFKWRRLINKTCKGCYAADTGMHPQQGKTKGCTLRYKTDGQGKPLEECPKPKSWAQLKRIKNICELA